MRTSNYIIYSFIPEKDEYYIVHGYTGAVDKVTASVAKYLLEHKDKHSTFHTKDEAAVANSLWGRHYVEPHEATIRSLAERGYLTDKSVEAERTYVQQLADLLHTKALQRSVPSFLIIPTYECNLRCPYCFETETRIQLNREKTLTNVMTRKQVDDVFHCIDLQMSPRIPSGKGLADVTKGMNICLYGGEPLSSMTRGSVEYIVEMGRARGMSFSAITNAVDLHLYTSLLGPDGVSWLQITLDGPKELHDRNRVGPQHRGTYETILDNIAGAINRDIAISVRLHANWKSVGRLEEVVREVENRGLFNYEKFGMYVQTTEGFHNGEGRPVYPNMLLHEVHDQLEKHPLSDKRIAGLSIADHNIPNKMGMYVRHGLAGIQGSMEYCGAPVGMQIYDPLGRIYSCWDTVGISGKEIGVYCESGPEFNDEANEWWTRSPGKIPECSDCKYIFFHFGGCAALPLFSGKGILGPACYDYEADFMNLGAQYFRTQQTLTLQEEQNVTRKQPLVQLQAAKGSRKDVPVRSEEVLTIQSTPGGVGARDHGAAQAALKLLSSLSE